MIDRRVVLENSVACLICLHVSILTESVQVHHLGRGGGSMHGCPSTVLLLGAKDPILSRKGPNFFGAFDVQVRANGWLCLLRL
jgi:hypothetical protein